MYYISFCFKVLWKDGKDGYCIALCGEEQINVLSTF